MFDFDKWQEILSSLRRHKLRTFLTALSVWWGIFMLAILLGAGNGLQNSVEHNFRDDAQNSLWIYQGKTSKPYKGLPAGRYTQFTNRDYELLTTEIQGTEHASGRYYMGGDYTVQYKGKPLSFDVRCVHPGHKVIENTEIITGRFLNDNDIYQYRKVCVIGQLVMDGFFSEGQDPIGQLLNIKGINYQIIGIFTDSGGDNEMRKIYLPITTAQRAYGGQERINQLMVTVKDATPAGSKALEEAIRQRFAAQHRFSPDDKQAIYINNNIENYQEFQMVFAYIKGFIWIVGIGSIIAGVVGISNIMLITVKDRTKEIGIRKAIGATPRSIISMILQEAIFITGLAGYIGLLSGFGLVYAIRFFMTEYGIELDFFRNPQLDFTSMLAAVILLAVCGTIAGLIPAMQAARINPVTAMRS